MNWRAIILALSLFLIVFAGGVLEAQTLQISIDNIGTPANGISSAPSISSDGTYIAFVSEADNLVAGDTNNVTDIFLHHQTELQATPAATPVQETSRISVANDGSQANGASDSPSMSSASGRFVAFVSSATNLVPGDTNGVADVFIRDTSLGQTSRISVPHNVFGAVTGEADGASFSPSISTDGCYVAFASDATNLNPLNSVGVPMTDTNGKRDIFLYYNPNGENGCNGGTPSLELISIAPNDSLANGDSYAPYFSSVRYVTFTSRADNLVSGDSNGVADIFLRDRAVILSGVAVDRVTLMASVDSNGAAANGESFSSQMQGPDIVFDSVATNLVSGDTNGKRDIFWRTLVTDGRSGGATEIVSKTTAGALGDGDSYAPSVSTGKNYIAFATDAANLSSENDCNQATDIVVRDYILSSMRRVNLTTAGYQSDPGFSNFTPAIAGGGVLVAYQAEGKLNTSDSNGLADIYVSVASVDPKSVSKPLERGEKLDEKPDVCVDKKKASVRLERFSSVSLGGVATASSSGGSYPCSGKGVCYQIQAVPVKSNGRVDPRRDRQQLVSKRNTVTIPNLRPGNYSVSFRAFGKSGSTIIKTNQSPARTVLVR